MGREHAVRDFLRAKRSALSPTAAGLPPSAGGRRVDGLRREEVALLAGVSVGYYTRLEQGRALNASESVLAALGRALQLHEAEVTHLRDLVGPASTGSRPGAQVVARVRPGVRQLLEGVGDLPALVLGRRWDVLATNRMARALLVDFDAMPVRRRNLLHWLCTDPAARDLFCDWEQVGADAVAALRRQAGRDACDAAVTALVAELSGVSADFVRWWSSQRVSSADHAVHRFHHPVAGEVELSWEALLVPGPVEQTFAVWTPAPGGPDEQALEVLASWAAPDVPARARPVRERA